jgi:hypothetical protein
MLGGKRRLPLLDLAGHAFSGRGSRVDGVLDPPLRRPISLPRVASQSGICRSMCGLRLIFGASVAT